jgi:hypothetical protein
MRHSIVLALALAACSSKSEPAATPSATAPAPAAPVANRQAPIAAIPSTREFPCGDALPPKVRARIETAGLTGWKLKTTRCLRGQFPTPGLYEEAELETAAHRLEVYAFVLPDGAGAPLAVDYLFTAQKDTTSPMPYSRKIHVEDRDHDGIDEIYGDGTAFDRSSGGTIAIPDLVTFKSGKLAYAPQLDKQGTTWAIAEPCCCALKGAESDLVSTAACDAASGTCMPAADCK